MVTFKRSLVLDRIAKIYPIFTCGAQRMTFFAMNPHVHEVLLGSFISRLIPAATDSTPNPTPTPTPNAHANTQTQKDKRPGGIGVAEALFPRAAALLAQALSVLDACPCAAGCLGCVLDARCASQNVNLDKRGSRELCARLVEAMGSGSSGGGSGGGESGGCGSGGVGFGSATAGYSGPLAVVASTSGAPAVESSPVRRHLRAARAMDGARERGAQIQPLWTNTLVPSYRSMHD